MGLYDSDTSQDAYNLGALLSTILEEQMSDGTFETVELCERADSSWIVAST